MAGEVLPASARGRIGRLHLSQVARVKKESPTEMSNELDQQPMRTRNPVIAGLCPELATDQLADAEYRLLGYLAIVKRIFERVCRDRGEVLTELERRARLRRRGGGPPCSSP